MTGGYLADGVTPGPLLTKALNYIDAQVGKFVAEIKARGLAGSTDIIVSAKHGQSPTVPSQLTRIDDGPIIDTLNTAWNAAGHPGKLVSFAIDDDAMLMWLSDRSPSATAFAKQFLLGHAGTGNDINGAAKPYKASGLATVYAGVDASNLIGVPHDDSRVPDLIGQVQPGVVYTGGKGKIAEHGGGTPADRNVPILVAGPDVAHARSVTTPVLTTQIAPTILTLLGLDPRQLDAVHLEHTAVLPHLG
jgi:arylsulfatase A-like enzyme